MWRIIISISLLFIIFSSPPLEPSKQVNKLPKNEESKLGGNEKRGINFELVKIDIEKVVGEIRMRIEQENEWFRYKFLFVGALILVLVAHLGAKKDDLSTDKRFENIMSSDSSLAILAIALVVAIAIDIHIRAGVTSSNRAGIWLNEYIVPLMKGNLPEWNWFKPWEMYLREAGSLHDDFLSMFFYWPHLHYLTLVMYALYLLGFYQRCNSGKNLGNSLSCQMMILGFWLVHISIILFAIMAHVAPSKYVFNFTIQGLTLSPIATCASYAGIALILLFLQWPTIRKSKHLIAKL